MKKIGLIMVVAFFVACNNAGNSTNQTDSSATKDSAKDNTNMYDTGLGSSMTDTAQRRDTSLIPNKMQDTATKK